MEFLKKNVVYIFCGILATIFAVYSKTVFGSFSPFLWLLGIVALAVAIHFYKKEPLLFILGFLAIVFCMVFFVSFTHVVEAKGLSQQVVQTTPTQEVTPEPTPETTVEAPTSEPTPETTVEENPCQHIYSEKIKPWCLIIEEKAAFQGFDPLLAAAIITVESNGDPNAISSSGAVGLMQIMPSDGISADIQCVNGPCFANRPTTAALLDPEFNIEYGTAFFAGLLNRNSGDVRESLFNYGPHNIYYTYADLVLSNYQEIKVMNQQ